MIRLQYFHECIVCYTVAKCFIIEVRGFLAMDAGSADRFDGDRPITIAKYLP